MFNSYVKLPEGINANFCRWLHPHVFVGPLKHPEDAAAEDPP